MPSAGTSSPLLVGCRPRAPQQFWLAEIALQVETKNQFDDFSNVEVLDANRDFAVQLALEPELSAAAPAASLWLCFADEGEAKLAKEAWPGAIYDGATTTSIAAALTALGGAPLKPFGAWAKAGELETAAASP